MFTGIIEELARLKRVVQVPGGARYCVESKVCCAGAMIGDSISVNGVCLTVVDLGKDELYFDVSAETLKRSNLEELAPNDFVNLERSLRADSRLGGHFVTGHIDATGKITSKRHIEKFIELEVEMPVPYIRYVVEKGSVALDGISLTINKIEDKKISIILIPHTISYTTLRYKKKGDLVNIEVDLLAKYTERLFNRTLLEPTKPPADVTPELLKEHGFI